MGWPDPPVVRDGWLNSAPLLCYSESDQPGVWGPPTLGVPRAHAGRFRERGWLAPETPMRTDRVVVPPLAGHHRDQPLACRRVEKIENSKGPAVGRPIRHEVLRLDVMARRGPLTNARPLFANSPSKGE